MWHNSTHLFVLHKYIITAKIICWKTLKIPAYLDISIYSHTLETVVTPETICQLLVTNT